jgi:hypothetical protein
MSTLPDTLTRKENVEPTAGRFEKWARRAGLLLVLAVAALGLANVFGQRASTATATSPEAELEVRAPAALRGGVIAEARFTIRARTTITHANLLLDQGWFDAMTLNSTEPDPVGWSQENGRPVIELGTIRAGELYVQRLQYQINPTAVGRRHQDVALRDGERPIAAVRRSILVYP